MSGFRIVIDSHAGISHKMAKEQEMEVIASTDAAEDQMIEILKNEENILFITTSYFYKERFNELNELVSKLSKEWKNRRFFLLDCKCLPVGTLILAEQARVFQNLGMLIEEVYNRLEDMIDIVQEIILVEDSHFSHPNLYLQKNYQGFIPSLFYHRPLVSLDKEGRFVQVDEIRGRDEGRRGLINMLDQQINHFAMEALSLIVGYIGSEEEAKILARRLEGLYSFPVRLVHMSSTMEEVLGTKVLGIFYLGKE